MHYTEESFLRISQPVHNCLLYKTPYELERDTRTKKDTENNFIGCYGAAQYITERKLIQNKLDLKSRKLHDANNPLKEGQKLSQIGS